MDERFREGMRLYAEKDYSRAEHIFREILNNDHTNHVVWNAIGVVFSKTGRYQLADEAFEQALILQPGNSTYEKNRDRNLRKIPSDDIPVPMVSHQDMERYRKWRVRGKSRLNIRTITFIVLLTLALCLLSGGLFAYSSVQTQGSGSGNGAVEMKVANELGNLAKFTLLD
ncbi:MAG TPA: tetratricopeptide repeat protein, partial [Methanospirillum sp.]|nr:tetratricopeptide repeat protein [Methanospirillum sp.]